MTLCTSWGCKKTPKTTLFWGEVKEFLCTVVQIPVVEIRHRSYFQVNAMVFREGPLLN